MHQGRREGRKFKPPSRSEELSCARAARATKSTIDFGREREQKRVLTVNEESAYCENRE